MFVIEKISTNVDVFSSYNLITVCEKLKELGSGYRLVRYYGAKDEDGLIIYEQD